MDHWEQENRFMMPNMDQWLNEWKGLLHLYHTVLCRLENWFFFGGEAALEAVIISWSYVRHQREPRHYNFTLYISLNPSKKKNRCYKRDRNIILNLLLLFNNWVYFNPQMTHNDESLVILTLIWLIFKAVLIDFHWPGGQSRACYKHNIDILLPYKVVMVNMLHI